MRIAQVGNYDSASQDGVTSVIVGLSDALTNQGVDVEVWQFRTGESEVVTTHREKLTLHVLPLAGGRVANTFRLHPASRRFLQEGSRRVDLMHIHSVFTPHNIWASRCGAPYVLSPHNGYSPRVRFGRRRLLKTIWFKLTEESLVRRSAAFHAVTENERDDLRLLRIPKPVFVIPNGVPHHVLRRDPRAEIGRYLLFLGRLDIHVKGLDLLLDGYAEARRQGPLPELVIAGPDLAGSRQVLEERAVALGIHDNVRFTGPVTGAAKQDLFDRAGAFMLTSRWEGFPLAALEAMAAGLPLIVTDETNLSPILKAHETGWSSPGTSAGIAGNLRTYSNVPVEALLAMADRARSCVAENYTWDRVSQQMIAMYRTVAAT